MPPTESPDITSILDTVKFMLGIQYSDESFNASLIIHINSVCMILEQLGVTDTVYVLTDNTDTWTDLLGATDDAFLSLVKSYIFLKVQSIFDPPSSGIVSTAMKSIVDEYEKRIMIQVETRPTV